jgi:hypothetical protein
MKDGAVDNVGSPASFRHVADWLNAAAIGSTSEARRLGGL